MAVSVAFTADSCSGPSFNFLLSSFSPNLGVVRTPSNFSTALLQRHIVDMSHSNAFLVFWLDSATFYHNPLSCVPARGNKSTPIADTPLLYGLQPGSESMFQETVF